jgi:hypothetical protein
MVGKLARHNVWDKISTLVAIEPEAQIIDPVYHIHHDG